MKKDIDKENKSKNNSNFIVLDRTKGGHVRRGFGGNSRVFIVEDIYEARDWFERLQKEEQDDPKEFFNKYFRIKVGNNGKFLGVQHFLDNNIVKKDVYYAWKYKFLQLEDITEYEMAMYVFGDIDTWQKLKKNSKPLREFLEQWKYEIEIIIKGMAFKRIVKDAKKNVSSAKYILEGRYKDHVDVVRTKKENEVQNKEASEYAIFSDEGLFDDLKEIAGGE